MSIIDLTLHEEQLERTIQRARERNIVVPTLAEQKNPNGVPQRIKEELKEISLWDIAPQNLFRITWHNEPVDKGGGFGDVNYIELPHELTGVEARIIALVGKWFPTGAHKVGAAFGCLVPKLVTGQFDPTIHKAVWPSTGNYCRGGAYDGALLGCESIAILPEEMSRERFEWLKTVAGEVITTPGGESNVKEIFDKVKEIRGERGDSAVAVFDQFSEFGNHLWHYEVTGNAMKEVLDKELGNGKYYGCCFTSGSAGTLGSADFLKNAFPTSKIAAGEALQCPTLLLTGYGAHRIEGIGDKHVPWIHNTKNTDLVIAIDDNDTMNLVRLFNEPIGRYYLVKQGVPDALVNKLDLLGISSIANVLMCIKMAKYYELTEKDVLMTVWTDSMSMYQSRLEELRVAHGAYSETDAAIDYHRSLLGIRTDNMVELNYIQRKRIHHLKYFTWIEQQGKSLEELDRQWYDYDNYWGEIHGLAPKIDELIQEFNNRVGLL